MLEVREQDNGVWVSNGRKRVWLSSNMLDTYETLYVNNGTGDGKIVYTIKDPLIVGERYSGEIISANVNEKMIVVNARGNSYQYLKHFGGWLGPVSDEARTKLLDDVDYTLVWEGDK